MFSVHFMLIEFQFQFVVFVCLFDKSEYHYGQRPFSCDSISVCAFFGEEEFVSICVVGGISMRLCLKIKHKGDWDRN